MSEAQRRLKTNVFKAIGHPTRIRILEFLYGGERCVCDIIAELELEQSNVSQHLGILKRQDLVTSRKDGTKMMYRLKHYMEIVNIIVTAGNILDKRLDGTGKTLSP